MGRRSRARAAATGPRREYGPPHAPEARAARAARAFNPIKKPTQRRTRAAAIMFAVGAGVFAVLGWAFGSEAGRGAAIPLAILAALWGLRALTMPRDADGEEAPDGGTGAAAAADGGEQAAEKGAAPQAVAPDPPPAGGSRPAGGPANPPGGTAAEPSAGRREG
jgi:hypothetical protein